MAHSYLLEIGLEEMPAHVVTPSIKQLHERVAQYLKEQRTDFAKIQEFATPRRLALLITGLMSTNPLRARPKRLLRMQMATGPKQRLALRAVKASVLMTSSLKRSRALNTSTLKSTLTASRLLRFCPA